MPGCTLETRYPQRSCPILARIGRNMREGLDPKTKRIYDRLFGGAPKNYLQSWFGRPAEQRKQIAETAFFIKNNDPQIRNLFIHEHADSCESPEENLLKPLGAMIVGIPQRDMVRLKGREGRTIEEIRNASGADILLTNDRDIIISGKKKEELNKILEMIRLIVEGPKIGKLFKGEVTKVLEFGLFVKLSPGVLGLVYVNEIPNISRHTDLTTLFKVGDPMMVKVSSVEVEDRWGNHRIGLTAHISEEELNNFGEKG